MSATFDRRVMQELLESAERDYARAARKEREWHDKQVAMGRERDRLKLEIERLSIPPEPKGTAPIVRFSKSYRDSARVYHFAAIKNSNGLWYATSCAVPQGATWQQLIEFVKRDNVLLGGLDPEPMAPASAVEPPF